MQLPHGRRRRPDPGPSARLVSDRLVRLAFLGLIYIALFVLLVVALTDDY